MDHKSSMKHHQEEFSKMQSMVPQDAPNGANRYSTLNSGTFISRADPEEDNNQSKAHR